MNLFISKDYSFCSNVKCKQSNNCKRHIKHYPQWENEYLSMLLVEDWEKCNMYVTINENKK